MTERATASLFRGAAGRDSRSDRGHARRAAVAAGARRARSSGRRACSRPCAMPRSAAASGCGRFWWSRRARLFGAEGEGVAARRVRARDGALLFARARRSAGHGRRRSAPRPPDRAQGLRRGDRHSRRRRPADLRLRRAGRSRDPCRSRPCAPISCWASRAAPGSAAWSAGRRSISRPRRRDDAASTPRRDHDACRR